MEVLLSGVLYISGTNVNTKLAKMTQFTKFTKPQRIRTHGYGTQPQAHSITIIMAKLYSTKYRSTLTRVVSSSRSCQIYGYANLAVLEIKVPSTKTSGNGKTRNLAYMQHISIRLQFRFHYCICVLSEESHKWRVEIWQFETLLFSDVTATRTESIILKRV